MTAGSTVATRERMAMRNDLLARLLKVTFIRVQVRKPTALSLGPGQEWNIGHAALSRFSNVITKDMGVALFVENGRILCVEPINCISVFHSFEWT